MLNHVPTSDNSAFAPPPELLASQLVQALTGLLNLVGQPLTTIPDTVPVTIPASVPRLPYGHGQVASIHWDRYRVNLTQRMYQTAGAPRDPWGDVMLPVDPAYFGEPAHKALALHYIGDRSRRMSRKRTAFEPPTNLERAPQADIEAALSKLRAELALRRADHKYV